MMNRKRLNTLITSTLASVMILGAVSIPTLADELNTDSQNTVIETKIEFKALSFDEYMNEIVKIKVDEKDYPVLKDLYEKRIALEKNGEYDEAKPLIGKFNEIILKYRKIEKKEEAKKPQERSEAIVYPNFEDFMKNDIKKKDISKENLTLLKDLYAEAIAFKKAGKMDAAKDVMAEFYAITDMYEDLYKGTPVTPIKEESKPVQEFKFRSLEEFMKEDIKKKDVSADDLALIKTHYEKYITLQTAGKFEASEVEMDKIFEITSKYEDIYTNTYVEEENNTVYEIAEVTVMSFQEFLKYDIKIENISEEDLLTMEELYTQYLTSNAEGDYSAASEAMNQIFGIASEY